ncbi:phage protease [Xanthomonas euvesicatoria pv. allii]|uniref:phage protease n=1 Tax=Xanthomonas euvesicatoria TaxID=456327 RepID=UPI0024074BE3|nr:phage protease [Xanthomonas euvesicatoria]MCP3048333.1 phage protease [Xanthomonas euvesicatoria pv. allii]
MSTASPRFKPSPRRTGVALAACAFELPPVGPELMLEIQLTPAGAFRPSDGRDMSVPAWRIDQVIASQVLERFNARRNPPVVDYEHQTLHKETNGQPAPAAAWMRALQWRDTGLWASVELTSRAAELIQAGEYRYVSPVFRYDENTGDVLAIEMAAFTNHPAIDGMEPLARRAAATFGFSDPDKDHSMNPLLKAILAALALPETTTEEQAIAACSALRPKLDTLDTLATALGTAPEGAVAACSALKARAAGAPDPAKYVPVSVVEDIKGQLAALSAENTDRKVSELVDQGLADGRLLPAQKDWATDLGRSHLASLTSYLATAHPVAALSATQTGGRQPAGGKDENGLTVDELAICTATGIDPKDFAASKPKA